MRHFRALNKLLKRWNESLIAPFDQLYDGRGMGWMRIEVIALIGVLAGQTDDVEQVFSNLFRIRRSLPLYTPSIERCAGSAMNVYRPDGDGISDRSMVGVIRAIGIARAREVQIADLAIARNPVVEVRTSSLSLQRAIEPA